MRFMGTLQCKVCFIEAEADNKETAISKIDHAANSKKCNGKDENCVWYPKGIPEVELNPVVDPKRPIEGISQKTKVVATVSTKKSTPKKSSN